MEKTMAVFFAVDENREPDWKRRAHLLETGDGADVHFLVGKPGEDEEKEFFAAHKSILSAGSRVFEQLFLFGNKIRSSEGTEEKPIEVRDVRPGAFRAMLKFVYSLDFDGVNERNIMEVYNAAKKYMLDHLLDRCRQSLINRRNLDADNALSVLKHAQQHEDQEIIDHCWSFIDGNATEILTKSDEFLALPQHDLCELFSRDSLDIGVRGELFLFQSLHRWAAHQCLTVAGLENTPENLRALIGPAIYQIRFPLLTMEQFKQKIVPTGLLNKEDIQALNDHFSNSGKKPINANAKRNKNPLMNCFNGQQRGARQSYKWRQELRLRETFTNALPDYLQATSSYHVGHPRVPLRKKRGGFNNKKEEN